MSYSEYINVFNKKREIDFEKVARICNKIYKPKFNSGYWEEDNIFDYISKSLEKNKNPNEYQEYLFMFCNHDGENDEEVHKCHKLFCKVCNYIYSCLIQLSSQIEEPTINLFWDRDNNFYSEYKDLSDEAYDFSKYFEKIDLLSKAEKIKDVDLGKLNL